MKELTVQAVLSNLEKVTDFVNDAMEEEGVFPKIVIQIDVALDELFTNISSYAYTPAVGDVTILVDVAEEAVELTFIDSGIPYDPLKKPDPDITLSAEERPIGGLGIFMVKKTMDSVRYCYEDGHNILTIRKNR